MEIKSEKVEFKEVQSKVGSLENVTHIPGGGRKRVRTDEVAYKHANDTLTLSFSANILVTN